MLDCGFGSFASYLENARTTRLDAIFISHAHHDHSFDVEAFVTFPSAWRERPRVIASRATIGALAVRSRRRPTSTCSSSMTEVTSTSGCFVSSVPRPRIKWRPWRLRSRSSGSRLVYTSDTGPGWSPPPAFRGPDLAILECTLESRSESSSPFHLDAQEAATLAGTLDARTTMITHVPPRESGQVRLDIAKRAAPEREFLLAVTGQRLRVESASEGDNYR